MSNRGQRTKQRDETRARISAAIDMYYKMNGYLPSIREIVEMIGIKSTSTVHRHLMELKENMKQPWETAVHVTKKGETSRMRILTAINTFYEKNGFSPTIRELVSITGLKSTATIHGHLIVLREQGKISWNPTMPRTIRVL